MMTPQAWRRARELFHACVDLPGPARTAFLDRKCADDPGVKSEVQSLLAVADAAGDFLEQPAVALAASLEPLDPDPWPGRRVGAYEIVALLGQGGMGEVYRAHRADQQFEQAVAIKLIRRGFAGEATLARFKAERQILASLDHPNIARILDGGLTEEGQPYFVMELIDGDPIDQYCDRCNLSIRERLELFCDVGAAVQYAHQHLTVHRDLKPGNILVTAIGVVKLLDFGIAKVLDKRAVAEAAPTAMHAMTPEYSSPEQIRGEPITTATDIYSLGVVLYRLLTGRRPYRATTSEPYALAREVCEEQPLKPSAALDAAVGVARRKQLEGDLDSIVLKALRKERDRRYLSVEKLIEDIRRHLASRPVLARQSSWGYTGGRFVRRNKGASLAVAAVVVALIGGIVATRREAQIADAQRDRAERHFQSVRQLANSFMFEVHDEIAKLPGSNRARELLVNKALIYLNQLAGEAGHDVPLQRELAQAYVRVGNVQGEVGFNNLGDHAGALRSYSRAIELLEQAVGADPQSRADFIQLATEYGLVSSELGLLGRPAEEQQYISKQVDLVERRLKREPADIVTQARLGNALFSRSQFRAAHGDRVGAAADAQRCVEVYESVVATRPDDKFRDNLVYAYANLGGILLDSADKHSQSRAIETLRKALSLIRRISAERPDDVKFQRHLAVAAGQLGAALADKSRPEEGLQNLEIVEGEVNLAKAYAAAAQAPAATPARRNALWTDAKREADLALRLADALVSSNPSVRENLAAFVADAGKIQQERAPP